MSVLDQSLLIANVNYHVGHWVAIYVAQEQGFFKEEGLARYEYERGGLLPWEPPGQAGEGTEEGDRRHGHHGGSPPAAPLLDLPEVSPEPVVDARGGSVGGGPGLQRGS